MDEAKEKREERSMSSQPLLTVIITIVLLLFLGGGVVVVVKNARRVQVQPIPGILAPTRVDTTMMRSRQQLKRGLTRLEKRLTEFRQKMTKLTPYQDSLFRECTRRLAEVWEEIAKVEAAATYKERKELMKTTKKNYVSLREMVNQFVISVDSTLSGPVLDSLDREFHRLLSD